VTRPFVPDEWSRLREVVVGRPFYRLPDPMPDVNRRAVPRAVWREARRCAGMTLEEAMPTAWRRLRDQLDGLATWLRAGGVRVHRVPAFRAAEEAHLAARFREAHLLFPRDPVLVAGSRVMELSVRDPRRRRERFPLRRLLRRVLGAGLARVRLMPAPDPDDSLDSALPFLDGGDCLVAASTVYVGMAPRGTTEAGVAWLELALGRRWRVETVAYDPAVAHLDCAMALLRPGLGIFAPALLPDGPPRSLAKWRWIEVGRDEALEGMAANPLPLDGHTVLMPEGVDRVARALRRRGLRVETVPFDTVTGFAGGLRCATQPLIRRG
jgi:N-dimethylarginine dimethylaminohydrolase